MIYRDYLEQTTDANCSDEGVEHPFRTFCQTESAKDANTGRNLTHLFEPSSSIVMMPYPTTMTAHDTHITGLQLPKRDTICPEITDVKEAPRENGSILMFERSHNIRLLAIDSTCNAPETSIGCRGAHNLIVYWKIVCSTEEAEGVDEDRNEDERSGPGLEKDENVITV